MRPEGARLVLGNPTTRAMQRKTKKAWTRIPASLRLGWLSRNQCSLASDHDHTSRLFQRMSCSAPSGRKKLRHLPLGLKPQAIFLHPFGVRRCHRLASSIAGYSESQCLTLCMANIKIIFRLAPREHSKKIQQLQEKEDEEVFHSTGGLRGVSPLRRR